MPKNKDTLGILITIPGEVQQAIENRALAEFPDRDEALLRAAFIVGAVYGYVAREFTPSASYHGAAADLGLMYGEQLRAQNDERCIEALWCPPEYLENPSEIVLQIISGQLSRTIEHRVRVNRDHSVRVDAVPLPTGRAIRSLTKEASCR